MASQPIAQSSRKPRSWLLITVCVLFTVFIWMPDSYFTESESSLEQKGTPVYGKFPKGNDPFHFLPCTNKTLPPSLNDKKPEKTWAKLYDRHPKHWNWGNETEATEEELASDPYAGRGIYLCGYIDVPLDYTNRSDDRIARLAVTKYQVSGLKRKDGRSKPSAGKKSERTIVVEPGGPGGSGTRMAWSSSELFSKRLSGGSYDILGWDPRGVNISQPSISCFPYDADRDRFKMATSQYREIYGDESRPALEVADAMNEALFAACHKIYADVPRFLTTAFVARDLEQIRMALDEDELTAHMISYGTGIGQTYVNMFPQSAGRIILDGTEYVRDQRKLAGFGLAALANVTDAWHDGFLGECINAGPEHCALAKSTPDDASPMTLSRLVERMKALFKSVLQRPVPSYTEKSGPSIITYSDLVGSIYSTMYNAKSWPAMAQALQELEDGNSTLLATMLEKSSWEYDPTAPPPPTSKPSSDELTALVVCGDAYDDAPSESGLIWWESLWHNMTELSWIAGNDRFFSSLPCRHFTKFWPEAAEVYRGDLGNKLKHPVLLIAETYDPATPLINGRRLLKEMGTNARLVAHHGYGHSSRDTSNCTDNIAKNYIMHGTVPDEPETACYANEKPYLYGVSDGKSASSPMELWAEHVQEMAVLNPRLVT